MDLLAFAAARSDRMRQSDNDLRPLVEKALEQWSEGGDWYAGLIDDASVLWLEHFEQEAPRADPDLFIGQFKELLAESLKKTSKPDSASVDRVTYWLTTVTVNNATYHGNRAHGGQGMRWVTMRDDSVRETHRAVNGQVAPRDGTFDVGGFDLHYPGEPVGPPEVWINCRCILAPARVEGAMSVSTITAAAVEDEFPHEEEGDGIHVDEDAPDEDLPVDELEDDEEEITEIPVHGVATIEGRPTGDGRQFAVGSLSFGSLPQPLGYEFESAHGGDNSRVAIVGRIDRFWTVEHPDGYMEARWSGVVFPHKEHAAEAIEGVIDGSIGGVSVIVDSVEVDVSEQRESLIARIKADQGEGAPEEEMSAEEMADLMIGDGTMPVTTFNAARIRRFDMVPTPAYQEAYLAIGDRFYDELDDAEKKALDDCGCASGQEHPVEVPADEAIAASGIIDLDETSVDSRYTSLFKEPGLAFAPGTKDGPGWITHPTATARIRRYWVRGKGAAKIRWGVPGDFNRCRNQLAKYVQNPEWLAGLCANMHKEAIGVWPGQEGGGRGRHSLTASAPPMLTLITEPEAIVAAAEQGTVKPAAAFKNPRLNGPTPLTIEGDRIYGHLATWGVCHIGIRDMCVTAPHSTNNYAGYRTGTVLTDEGPMAVGNITMGTGHASIKANAKDAVAHYDNTGSVVADVVTGEDSFGIWFAGVLRPGLTADQVDALRASALSGDWRYDMMTGNTELCAALAVNVPGYPIPRTIAASGAMGGALVAAGIVTQENAKDERMIPITEVPGIVRESIREYRLAEKREERTAALAPFFAKVEQDLLDKIKAKFLPEGVN